MSFQKKRGRKNQINDESLSYFSKLCNNNNKL